MDNQMNLGEAQSFPSSHKQLPPYGRNLIELNNDLFVFIGEDSWDYAKWHKIIGHAVLVLPHGDLPQQYKWDMVKNRSVLVITTSSVPYQLVRSLAYELLRAKAYIVRAVSLSGSFVVFRQGDDR